jgi:thioredoxin reductase (NADPH)
MAFCKKFVAPVEAPVGAASASNNIDQWNPDHGFEYDLIVIGGGSGGLSTAREAVKNGAKVACLDFVKPSPAGSKWGLGGTCVNVGCIPKKLMHNAALLGEHSDASASYGWNTAQTPTHDWDTLRTNVQDHIKGLNFGYRVALREEGIKYLNKLGRFIGPNEVECTDAKGNVSSITGARFVIAVGGRPTPLDCPGGEHAITSDDLFMMKTPPGKTCVVGAGYVALECAGFITGLKSGDVTVLVRSMLLRGFDRQLVEKVQECMQHNGTKIIEGVTPKSIEKLPSGKLLVTYSDGQTDEYDTVLAAVGRYMDTEKLGIDAAGALPLSVSKKGKLVCQNEQTSVPHVYAVGDIVEGAPELTPVAIKAGRLLSKRLFGKGTDVMVYRDVATVVFTPLELGTVGLSEEDAIAELGEDNVEIYSRSFHPLEWSIVESAADLRCVAKVVVEKDTDKVIGMHIASPNAGEIIQGFALAFASGGLTHTKLLDCVGIHPTIAEEFCGLDVSKSSGLSTEKSGC